MRLIDAESLKENLSKWLKQVDPTHPSDIPPMDDIIVSTIMTIEEEPTVDAMPVRHGKYIGTEFDGYADGCPVYYEWKCSECGCVFEDEEPKYRYCPNCGAEMG